MHRPSDETSSPARADGEGLNPPSADVAPTFGTDERPPEPIPVSIGKYHVLGVLGHGGMGTVYKAEQRHPIRRTVAIKVVKAGFDTREVVARFESERQALARMDHPNIARVLDAGTTDAGRSYFVMEYVPGKPITRFADENRLTIPKRLELFSQVCQAIHHAHTKAIIHRDIKSSNVLAFTQDAQAHVKIIDFGIAKALTSDRLTEATFATDAGLAVGTFEYMSPEQADGSPDIDTRTDIYSLGVLLYELLTGEKPFERATLAKQAEMEIRRVIRDIDPPRPSTRLTHSRHASECATARRATIDDLARVLRSELEWIPLKALRKDRNERYASASEMADDVANYLASRPLLAAPESATYKLRKFLVRYRGPVAIAALFIAVLSASAVVMGFQAQRNRRLATSEASAKEDALRAGEEARGAQRLAEQQRAVAETERGHAEASARAERLQLYAARVNLAQQAGEAGETTRMLDLLNSVRPAPGDEDLRGFEWFHLWQRCHSEKELFQLFGTTMRCMAVAADHRTLATADDQNVVKIWKLPATVHLGSFSASKRVYALAFSPDGKTLAVGGGDTEDGGRDASPGFVSLWDLESNKPDARTEKASAAVYALKFSPDGKLLVGGLAHMMRSGHTTNATTFGYSGRNGAVQLWDPADLRTVGSADVEGPGVQSIALRRDGSAVAVGTVRGDTVCVFDVPSLHRTRQSRRLPIDPASLSFSGDDKTIAVGGTGFGNDRGGFCVLDANLEIKSVLAGISGGVLGVEFLGGERNALLVSCSDRALRIYDMPAGHQRMALRGHANLPLAAIPSADGATLVSGSRDGTVRVWDAVNDPAEMTLPFRSLSMGLAFSPDGRWLAGGGFEICDLNNGSVRTLASANNDHSAIAFTPDSKTLITGDESLHFWKLTGGGDWTLRQDIPLPGKSWCVAVSPDGRLVAVAGQQTESLDIRDVSTGEVVDRVYPRGKRHRGVSFSADGRRLLTSTWESGSSLQVWDMTTPPAPESSEAAMRRQPLYTIDVGATSALFSPDGKTFAATGRNGTIRVFRTDDGTLLNTYSAHTNEIWSLAFSTDSRTIASASWDGTVKFWAASTGALLMTLRPEGRPEMWGTAFSHDGRMFATTGNAGEYSVHVYRATDQPSADDDPEAVRLRALALQGQGKIADARGVLRSAIQRYEQRFGTDDVEAARARLALAEMTIQTAGSRAEFADAESLIAQARKAFSTRLPPGHDLRWAALFALRKLYAPAAMNEPAKLADVERLINGTSVQPASRPATQPASSPATSPSPPS